MQWLKKPFRLDVPSDHKYDCMDWCGTHLDQHLYEYKPFTGPYYDTWLFESVRDLLSFGQFISNKVGYFRKPK